jgi:DNA-binding transcriptional MerR regulator
MSGQNEKLLNKSQPKIDLPLIPDKLYFTIGEVSLLCDLKSHVLRYWEEEFSQLSPSKRRGNRRYYQRKDVLLIRRIRDLLYEQGYTIEGARTQLAEKQTLNASSSAYQTLKQTLADLEQILVDLEGHSGA